MKLPYLTSPFNTGCIQLVIGPMGSGKTTLAKGLRARGLRCFESDESREDEMEAILKPLRRSAILATDLQEAASIWQEHNTIWHAHVLMHLDERLKTLPHGARLIFIDHDGRALLHDDRLIHVVENVLCLQVNKETTANRVLNRDFKNETEKERQLVTRLTDESHESTFHAALRWLKAGKPVCFIKVDGYTPDQVTDAVIGELQRWGSPINN